MFYPDSPIGGRLLCHILPAVFPCMVFFNLSLISSNSGGYSCTSARVISKVICYNIVGGGWGGVLVELKYVT